MGPDELLGRDGHHQLLLRHPRRRHVKVVTWLWGGYSVTGATLNRFYRLHYLLPFVIAGLVVLHIWALHVAGQNNPTGVEIKTKSDSVPMSPYAVMKDLFALSRVRDAVRLVRVLRARLSRPRRQLRARPTRW